MTARTAQRAAATRRALLASSCALALAAAAAPPAAQTFDLRDGTLSYRVVHKLHAVEGVSRALEGKAVVLEDGTARVQVRAKVASFDSGNGNRDAHMREAVHEAVHPYCSVKGTLRGLRLPLAAPVEVPMAATVELNGEKQPASLTVALSPEAGGGVKARFSFPVSLEAFKVERPELLFVKVDDEAQIRGELRFAAEAP